MLTRPLPLVVHSCESDGQHQETGDKCPNPISKRNQCCQANHQSAGVVRKRPSRSRPSIQMCVPPGWSRCRSQVAHPFPSTTSCSKRAGSPGLAAWQQPFVKFSYSQIHIVSSDPNVPPTHLRFIQLPRCTISHCCYRRQQTVHVHSVLQHNGFKRKGLPRDAHAMQMELSEGAAAAAAQFIR